MYLSHRQRRYLTPPQSPSPKTFPQITPHQTRRRLLLLVSAAVAISLFSCFSSSFLSRSSKTATQGLNLNMSSPAAAADPATVWDTFYISHGSPTLSIDETIPARHFLQRWKDEVLPARPKAILVISGHWEAHVPSVNAVQGPLDTIYDFYGFPKSMYQIKYPAPGAPELANRVKELLMQSGFDCVHVDKKRGLDHGAWVPLMLMYPEADIPVCQLSVLTSKDGTYHYNMGKALAPLRNEGVLVFGSGSATHNLRKLQMNDPTPPVWAAEFDNWLEDSLVNQRYGDVNEWDKKAPHAKTAHPWPDHFYPLHVAIGAAGGNPKAELIHRSWGHGTLSYASYRFT